MCCANCGGDHSAAYSGCLEFQRAAKIQVKTTGKLSYAEAVLKVPKIVLPMKEVNLITKTTAPIKIQTTSVGCQTESLDQEYQTEHTSGMEVSNISRMGFIGFITEVVNLKLKYWARATSSGDNHPGKALFANCWEYLKLDWNPTSPPFVLACKTTSKEMGLDSLPVSPHHKIYIWAPWTLEPPRLHVDLWGKSDT